MKTILFQGDSITDCGRSRDAVIANTQLGTLVVQGKELQLKTLLPEGGQVAVEGNISGLMYEEPRSVGSWWQRMFG